MQIINLRFSKDLNALKLIERDRDIMSASSETLELIGKEFGVERGTSTDDALRTKIIGAVLVGSVQADYESIVSAINLIFGREAVKSWSYQRDYYIPNIRLFETEYGIVITGITREDLQNSGLTGDEVRAIIQKFLPVGIKLGAVQFSGTFMLSARRYTTSSTSYSGLYNAWRFGQFAKVTAGMDVGLKGNLSAPSTFMANITDSRYQITGYSAGGTLGGE